jgi:DNA polymerase-3 subunit delta'
MSTHRMSWPGVFGHDWAIDLLTGALGNDRLSHAYLLTGPAHIGKTTLARAFAQTLNCEVGGLAPCGACRACQLIAGDRHPDVRLIRPELASSGRKETLRIEQVRNLQKALALAPYEARYQVAILTRFHRASLGGANALLKTLEEPPERVIIILTADLLDPLLPTIVSRCQSLSLRPLPLEKVESALLEGWKATEDQAHQLAHLSGGRLGLAVRLLSDPHLLALRQEQLDALESLLHQDRTGRFLYAERMARKKRGTAIVDTLELWLGWWRDVVLIAGGDPHTPFPITNLDRIDRITRIARECGLETACEAVRSIQETIWQLERNANTRLAIEVLMLNLPFLLTRSAIPRPQDLDQAAKSPATPL